MDSPPRSHYHVDARVYTLYTRYSGDGAKSRCNFPQHRRSALAVCCPPTLFFSSFLLLSLSLPPCSFAWLFFSAHRPIFFRYLICRTRSRRGPFVSPSPSRYPVFLFVCFRSFVGGSISFAKLCVAARRNLQWRRVFAYAIFALNLLKRGLNSPLRPRIMRLPNMHDFFKRRAGVNSLSLSLPFSFIFCHRSLLCIRTCTLFRGSK